TSTVRTTACSRPPRSRWTARTGSRSTTARPPVADGQQPSPMPTPRSLAPLLLLPGGLALLTGMDAGLTLAGAPAPVGRARLAELHGPLMVLGFLGTVIALERATALRAAWGFLAPGLCAAGALALVLLPAPLLGRLLLAQGLLILVV